jgi:hypothetical protein
MKTKEPDVSPRAKLDGRHLLQKNSEKASKLCRFLNLRVTLALLSIPVTSTITFVTRA